jgi:hypothetical protein
VEADAGGSTTAGHYPLWVISRERRIRFGAPDELVPLTPEERSIKVTGAIDSSVWPAVGALHAGRPEIHLLIDQGEDLEGLRWFTGLRDLTITTLRLRTLLGLRHVAGSLERLLLGDTLRNVSLAPVGDLGALRRLAINGTWKDVEPTLGRLVMLERLGLGSVDVEALLPLTQLRRFESGLATLRHLDALPAVGRLELIELWRLRGEHDLAPLARIASLRYLLLSSTRSITSLPSFAESRDLRWVALDAMRGITDLQSVADAPNLEVCLLVGMNQIQVDDLRPFVGHPTLRAAIWGLGSKKRNDAAAALLPFRPSTGGPPPWNEPSWTGIRHPNRT